MRMFSACFSVSYLSVSDSFFLRFGLRAQRGGAGDGGATAAALWGLRGATGRLRGRGGRREKMFVGRWSNAKPLDFKSIVRAKQVPICKQLLNEPDMQKYVKHHWEIKSWYKVCVFVMLNNVDWRIFYKEKTHIKNCCSLHVALLYLILLNYLISIWNKIKPCCWTVIMKTITSFKKIKIYSYCNGRCFL